MLYYFKNRIQKFLFFILSICLAGLLVNMLSYARVEWQVRRYSDLEQSVIYYIKYVSSLVEADEEKLEDLYRDEDHVDSRQIDYLETIVEHEKTLLEDLYNIRIQFSQMHQELDKNGDYTKRFIKHWNDFANQARQTLAVEDFLDIPLDEIIGFRNYVEEEILTQEMIESRASLDQVKATFLHQIFINFLTSFYILIIPISVGIGSKLLNARKTSLFKFIPANYTKQLLHYFGPKIIASFAFIVLIAIFFFAWVFYKYDLFQIRGMIPILVKGEMTLLSSWSIYALLVPLFTLFSILYFILEDICHYFIDDPALNMAVSLVCFFTYIVYLLPRILSTISQGEGFLPIWSHTLNPTSLSYLFGFPVSLEALILYLIGLFLSLCLLFAIHRILWRRSHFQ